MGAYGQSQTLEKQINRMSLSLWCQPNNPSRTFCILLFQGPRSLLPASQNCYTSAPCGQLTLGKESHPEPVSHHPILTIKTSLLLIVRESPANQHQMTEDTWVRLHLSMPGEPGLLGNKLNAFLLSPNASWELWDWVRLMVVRATLKGLLWTSYFLDVWKVPLRKGYYLSPCFQKKSPFLLTPLLRYKMPIWLIRLTQGSLRII